MEKKLVVTYINVSEIKTKDIESYMFDIQKKLTLENTDTIQWFIPVKKSESKVEIFNL